MNMFPDSGWHEVHVYEDLKRRPTRDLLITRQHETGFLGWTPTVIVFLINPTNNDVYDITQFRFALGKHIFSHDLVIQNVGNL